MSSCCCKCKCQGFVSQIWRKNICLDCFHSKEAHNGIKFDEYNPPKSTIKKKKKTGNEEINVNRSNEEPIMKLVFDTNDSTDTNLKGSRRKRRTLDLESPKSVEEIAENLRKETQLRVNKEVEVNKAIIAFKEFTSILKNTLKDKSPNVIGYVIQEFEKQFDLYVTGNLEKIEITPQQEIERLQLIEEQKIKEEKERKRKEKEKKRLHEREMQKDEDSKSEKSKEDSYNDNNKNNKSNDDDDSQMNDSNSNSKDEENKNYKNNDNINNNNNKIDKNRDESSSMTEEEEIKLKMTIQAMMKKKKINKEITKKKEENKKKEPKHLKDLEDNADTSSFDDLKSLIGNGEILLDPQEQSSENESDSKKMISEESNLQDLLGGQNILDKLNLNENESEEQDESEKQESEKKEIDNDSEDSLISSSPAITPNSSLTSNIPKDKQRPSVLKYFSYGKRKDNVPHKSLFGLFAPPNNDKQDHPPRKVLKTNETSSPSASIDDSESVDSESTSLKKLLIKSTTDIPPELKISSTEDLLSKLDSEFVDLNTIEDQSLFVFEGNQVICQYGVVDNINKAGLKRAKKTELNVRGKPLYEMQDFHFCEFPFNENKFLGLFAVFDGHAGALCASDATKYLPEVFSELWNKKYSTCNENEKFENEQLLTDTFVNLDKKLEQHLYQGCTATISIIWSVGESRFLQVANVGDSRAYLCRSKSVICLTEDHKLSNPNERKRVLEMGVMLAPKADRIHGLAVTRALGDIFLKQEKQGLTEIPHLTKPIQIRNDDRFLIIASDGLWDIMDGDQAYRLIKDMNDPKEMASILIKNALKSRDCNDNITVCVVILN